MPHEIFDPDKFLEIATRASEVRVRRQEDTVKLKLRTKTKLYTFKASPEEANAILQRITVPVVDV